MHRSWRLIDVCVGVFTLGLLVLAVVLSPGFVERHLSPDGSITAEMAAMVSLWRAILFCAAVLMMGLWIGRRPLARFLSRYALHRGQVPPERLSARDLMGTPGLGRLGMVLWIALPIWLVTVNLSFAYRIQWPRFLLGEYGFFENGTAFLYLFAGVCAFVIAFRRHGVGRHVGFHCWWMLLLGAFCIFVAGEEVNWGQVYFHFDTPELFEHANYQNEVSLHNIRLPQYFFLSQMYWANEICMWIALAGAIGPWLLYAAKRLKRLVWTWEIPIPSLLAQGFFAAGALMPLDTDATIFGWQMRPTEMREFSLAVAFAVWIYSERNRWRIYVDASCQEVDGGDSRAGRDVRSDAA
ncbi:MAG: hypothetical protein ACM3VT_20395 [Solirubrobacterales bacterium]